MKEGKKSQKVFVGVSGGVDSSVSAALLQSQGFDVVGVFIRTWQPEWMVCSWRAERRDAMRVCAHLNIPFLECDLTEEYKQGVADYMISEYKQGRTPNPDVMCNKVVKFGGFYNWARACGADYIATGHYAQVLNNTLVRGIDPAKDQSYFLWTIAHEQLAHILFPIGHLEKKEVRKLAEKYALPTATKKDSQGICFIGDISMKEFLSHYIDEQQGDVLDESGKVIGHHPGALFFTMGERHGFIITEKGTDDAPMYVVAKDVERNTITVAQGSNGENPSLVEEGWPTGRGGVITEHVHSKDLPLTPSPSSFAKAIEDAEGRGNSQIDFLQDLNGEQPLSFGGGEAKPGGGLDDDKSSSKEQLLSVAGHTSEAGGSLVYLHSTNDLTNTFSQNRTCQCQIRYHGEVKECEIREYNAEKNTLILKLKESDRTLASGQSIVLYDGEVCLGGGIID